MSGANVIIIIRRPQAENLGSAGFCFALGVCEYLALAVFAYAVMRFWDRPVRRALSESTQHKTTTKG